MALAAAAGLGISARAQQTGEPVTLTVIADQAAVLVAPVADAPVAGEVGVGDSFPSEAEVNGEEIGGSPRWHLVTAAREPELIRGFIHSSLVAATP